jgi:hypothetical protein
MALNTSDYPVQKALRSLSGIPWDDDVYDLVLIQLCCPFYLGEPPGLG